MKFLHLVAKDLAHVGREHLLGMGADEVQEELLQASQLSRILLG